MSLVGLHNEANRRPLSMARRRGREESWLADETFLAGTGRRRGGGRVEQVEPSACPAAIRWRAGTADSTGVRSLSRSRSRHVTLGLNVGVAVEAIMRRDGTTVRATGILVAILAVLAVVAARPALAHRRPRRAIRTSEAPSDGRDDRVQHRPFATASTRVPAGNGFNGPVAAT
jgi:hypothetical protein